ncbi:methionine biosynthesis protein MetW [Desulfoprunum benzoelyticum]|uniref:Methionine biosynthesis protein MetW n=1 Tax=Desulfoprunum benzoelyticum TaxID=1506996 RepID=A0A840V927_9BACT|nr:methionine biosynthesis protein MetW [Desulfoprunum benzoelyticum]MBB5349441.1 methionine biosynthesis protein MetW [Desulfoprunum benzoelyticum]MBM9531702.1 methionine biosynthesis protein MetW [Desulfoprunum benzoelyticum]
MASPQPEHIRFDLQVIASLIEPGSRVLDLGCGSGDLLAWLAAARDVRGAGIEQDKDKAARCIARGLSVLQGDLNAEVEDYPDASFDYVILSQTLQQVYEPARLLRSLARIGRRVIVSFPNFSHWTIRLQLLWRGMAPKNDQLPYSWYDTPNIRVITLADFRRFARDVGYRIVREIAIDTDTASRSGKVVEFLADWRATYGIFIIEQKNSDGA